jgi:hypothetical protein
MNALDFFHDTCQPIPDAKKGAMFGWECYKCGTKPFIFFDRNTEDGAAFKLSGEVYNEALNLPNAEVFNPGDKGKPMKNWVVVPYAQRAHWQRLALFAFEEVLKEPIKLKKNGK